MIILATNDDGVYAPGLWASVQALREVGDVVVAAPDREQSGVGTAITLNHPVHVREVMPLIEGVRAYAVEGTPADSTILGVESLVGEKIDLVVSGINPGANMGNDVFISGTVGAALQAFFRGIPAIAVSVTALKDVHFTPAANVIRQIAQEVSSGSLAPPLLLNINVPNVPQEKLKGVSLTHLGQRTYMDVVKEEDNGRRKFYWITRESPGWVLEKGLDVWTIRRRRVSITPIHTDLTASARTKAVRKVTRDLRVSLKSNLADSQGSD